tara:strand:+ start:216 stop:464 length:249 start_codon:yes stop_codon:yes gene_type:complete
MDKQILIDLDNAVIRSKEITKIVGKLQSAFYTNDEQKIEDYLELTRTYSHYAIDELNTVVNELDREVSELYGNVIEFPQKKQ